MSTPTVRRLQLGKELARLRNRAGVKVDDAAKVLHKTAPVISRLEHGETALRPLELRALLESYAERITEGEPVDIDWYLEFNQGSENRGRWAGYRSSYGKYFRMAVDLEEDAAAIDMYQIELIPGLFQVEAYMRALFSAQSAEQREDLVAGRLDRQKVLTKLNAPQVTVVMSESTLRRQVGTLENMQDQLGHLIKLSELANVKMHVLPFRDANSMAVENAFIQFRIPALDPNAPALNFVYVETHAHGSYLDGNEELSNYNQLWNKLLGVAMDPDSSREFIMKIQKEYKVS